MMTGAFHDHLLWVCCAQIFLATLSVVLVARIAERAFRRPGAGVAAAWFFACDPLSIEYSIRLMSETLFVFLLLLSLDRMVVYLKTRKTCPLLLAAILLASATYVRPVGYWLALCCAGFFALYGAIQTHSTMTRAHTKNIGVWGALLFITVFALLVIPWQIRNFHRSGYAGFSSVVEKNLYFYEAAAVTATIEHRTLLEEQIMLGKQDDSYFIVHPEQAGWTQGMRLKFMRAEAMHILSAHPFVFFATYLRGLGVVSFSPGATEFLRMIGMPQVQDVSLAEYLKKTIQQGSGAPIASRLQGLPESLLVSIVFEIFLVAVYVLAMLRLTFSRGGTPAVCLIALVSFYFLLVSGGGQAVSRLRTPAMPGIAILAGGGIAQVLKPSGKRKNSEDAKW
uniref:Glycosyltransferase RgtA/B/C/D-like domain-containing protein n=1 Tax=mine drainage metagenome TaxID=410659 RepID=E6QMK9_9ZZZZ